MSNSSAQEIDAQKKLGSLVERARELESMMRGNAATDGHGADHHDVRLFVADRLMRSVIRPLNEALRRSSGEQGAPGAAADQAGERAFGERAVGAWLEARSAGGEALLRLTEEATALRVTGGVPEVQEATATLQDLARRWAGDDSEDEVAGRLAGCREMMASLPPGIQSETDGPYLVTNAENLATGSAVRCRVAPRWRCAAVADQS